MYYYGNRSCKLVLKYKSARLVSIQSVVEVRKDNFYNRRMFPSLNVKTKLCYGFFFRFLFSFVLLCFCFVLFWVFLLFFCCFCCCFCFDLAVAQCAVHSCEICDNNPGSQYCTNCEQYFCSNCKLFHLKAKLCKIISLKMHNK